ncbi:transglutaminase family protein [Sulfurirhabdus autotrophica]|uniref:Transglutaminase-like putative cysteine protease n=1 Tax=Sulfurirhabdus autotrophica TaxID=1706046 RepID=A0A4R3XR18_9PROT|nr:transglutaminase family protein [Sulfurirhabdus autotrophica]TCV79283.1 transglutaminase-like putative cysteine protease [Sulfurirhabdus autotrophica]
MHYRVIHKTEYEYSEAVGVSFSEARLLPRTTANQNCRNSQLQVFPVPTDYRERVDFFGNRAVYFSIREPHQQFVVTATSEVHIDPQEAQLNFSQGLDWESVRLMLRQKRDEQTLDALQYTLDSPFVSASPELAAYAQISFPRGRSLLEAVNDLMGRIHKDFTYDPEFTTLATPLSTVLEHRRGVCQDFAHLAIGCLRAHGLAARYVSGYIETFPPPGKEKLVGSDASHAWFSVFVPELGWMDFDPTNNQIPVDQHIVVGWGRDYGDVNPLKGVIFGGGEHKLEVSVDVRNLGG